jgi:hypothetical protein
MAKFKFDSSQTTKENKNYKIGDSKFDGRYIYKENYNPSSKEFSMKIRGFTLSEEKEVKGIKLDGIPCKIKLSNDGKLLAVILDIDEGNVMKIIDTDKSEIIKTISDKVVRFIEFSNDNEKLYMAVYNKDNYELSLKVISIFD